MTGVSDVTCPVLVQYSDAYLKEAYAELSDVQKSKIKLVEMLADYRQLREACRKIEKKYLTD
jgi:hypothetical protein